MQPRGRYVRLNAVDYILIVTLVLLILTLPLRGILFLRDSATDKTCRANVEFVIRGVDAEARTRFETASEPFYLSDGTALSGVTVSRVRHAVEHVTDESGNMQELESPTRYDVYFSTVTEGARAEDGTFLLFGVRRLSIADSMPLSHAGHAYTAVFVSVSVLP